jgi:hypothetical protein
MRAGRSGFGGLERMLKGGKLDESGKYPGNIREIFGREYGREMPPIAGGLGASISSGANSQNMREMRDSL